MATQVEVNSVRTSISLAELNEITNEATSPRTHISPLSDASNKASDLLSPSASFILGEKNTFGKSFKPMTLASESRPRLSPKPYYKEQSSELVGIRKPPITTPKLHSLLTSSLYESRHGEHKPTDKELHGSASIFIDKKNIESERSSYEIFTTKNRFYYNLETNNHETTGINRSKSLRLTQGGKVDLMPITSVQTKEWRSSHKFEVESKTSPISRKEAAIFPRETLNSSNTNQISIEPGMANEKEFCLDENSKVFTKNAAHDVNPPAQVQPRMRRRPVSAIFLSPEDQKQDHLENKEVEPQLSDSVNPFVRKPRPLSMNVTSKCGNNCSLQFVSAPSEIKENVTLSNSTEHVLAEGQTEVGMKKEDALYEFSKLDFKSKGQGENLKFTEQNLDAFDIKTSLFRINTYKHRNYEMESKQKIEMKENEIEMKMLSTEPTSEESKGIPNDKPTLDKGWASLDQREHVSVLEENSTDNMNKEENITPGDTIKKRISLLFSVSTSPAVAELQTTEKEKSNASIQQRIKELTTDNSDVNSGNAQRSFQSRPLSADLTKMFLGPGSSSEIKSVKQVEKNSDCVEVQIVKVEQDTEHQKNKEDRMLSRTNFDGPSEWNLWKMHQSAQISDKDGQLVEKGNLCEHRSSSCCFRNKSSVSPTNYNEENINHTISSAKEGSKTVRATLFEHRVEWHNASDALSVTGTVLETSSKAARKPDVLVLPVHERDPGTKRGLEGKMHLREEYCSQFAASDFGREAVKAAREMPYDEEKKIHHLDTPDNCTLKKHNKKASSYTKDSQNYQRIEPRYETVQTISTRALSEYITMAPEDKAVTLRSQKSSFHKKDKIKTDVKIISSDIPYKLLDNTVNQFKEATLTTEDKNILESTGDKPDYTELKTDRNHVHKDKMTQLVSDERNAEKTFCTTEKPKAHSIKNYINVSDYKSKKKQNASSQCPNKTKNETSKALECSFSENEQVKTVVTDTLYLREMADKQSTKDHSHKSWISGYGSNQSSDLFTDNLPRTELIAVDKGESRFFGLKQYQKTGKINKDVNVNVLTKDYAGDQSKALELEDHMRKHDCAISELKMSERWKKKSTSQDVERCEESKLIPHSTRSLSDRDVLQLLEEPELIQKSNDRREFVDSNMVCQNVLCSESGDCKDSSLEPKATYFAVTCQVADYKDACESPRSEIGKINVAQGVPGHISEDNSIRYRSALPHSSANLALHRNNDLSLETDSTNKLAKGEHKDTESTPKHGMPNKNTNLDEYNRRRRTRNKSTGHMKENVIDDNGWLKGSKEKSSRSTEDKFPPYREPNNHPMQKEMEKVVQRKPGNGDDSFKVDPKDGYRSGILDIDALMVDYTSNYCRVNKVQERQSKVREDQKTFQREKSKSLQVKNEPCSHNWEDQMESPQTDRIAKYFAEDNRPVKIDLCSSHENSVKVDSSVNVFSVKQKYRGKRLDERNWEKQVSAFSEKHSDSLMEASDKGITKMNIKEKEIHSEIYTDNLPEPTIPVIVHVLPDPIEDSSASRVTDDSCLQKALSKKYKLIEKSDSNQQKRIDTTSGVNEGNRLASLKNDLMKFQKSLNEYSLDLKQSPSGKNQFANTRDIVVQQEKEGRRSEQQKIRQSSEVESAESCVEKRRSLRHVRASTDYQKDTDEKGSGHSYQRSYLRESKPVTSHKRSRSLHRERVEDLQPVGSCFYDQLKQCFARPIPASKDKDTLVREADSHYGTWSGDHQSQDSFVPGSPSSDNVISTRKQPPNSRVSSSFSHPELDHHDATKDQRTASLDCSSIAMDSVDGTVLPPSVSSFSEEKENDFSFMDQPSVLDSSALKNRVQLSRRSHRRAPTLQSQRRSKSHLSESQFAVIEESDSTWMFKDTTDEKPEKEDESEDEEGKTPKSAVQPQRLPVFPGMDPSVLKAQLRKRQESDSPTEASGSAHLYTSPKSSFQQSPFGGRQLPSAAEKDRTIEMSPQWLQELKSKKRLSQYENNV